MTQRNWPITAIILALAGSLVLAQDRPQAGAPLVITAAKHYDGPLLIENRRITCTEPNQPGLHITFPEAPAVAETTVILRNITVTPGCANGVICVNCWNALMDAVNVYGAYGDRVLQNGIVLQGQSHDVRVSNATVMHAITGMYVMDVAEGTTIDKSTFLGVEHGVFASSTYAGRPWLNISNSHIAASRAGIVAINRKQVTIHDTLIYRHLRGYQTGLPWEGLILSNVEDASLRGVIIDRTPDAAQKYPGVAIPVSTSIPPRINETIVR